MIWQSAVRETNMSESSLLYFQKYCKQAAVNTGALMTGTCSETQLNDTFITPEEEPNN